MPLMSFSEPEHVSKLLEGTKRQITRRPRKNPLKVGDKLYCYYKSRQKKSCNNCILRREYGRGNCSVNMQIGYCSDWSNYFGEAITIRILPFNDIIYTKSLAIWAKLDGFESYEKAWDWFAKRYTTDWKALPFEVITFEPKWVKA